MEILKDKQQAIELSKNYEAVEVWQWTQDRRYCKSYPYPHTDSIEYVGDKIERIQECAFGEDTYALVLDADEYNHTIYANCGETTDEEQTLVVMLPYNWQERGYATRNEF